MADLPGVGLITGAASGIGRATALAFIEAGCTRLALTDINADGLTATKQQIFNLNPKATVFTSTGNTTDASFVDVFVETVVREFGRLDYAVNCAGTISDWAISTELDLEKDHDRIMNINYRGTFLCSRAEIRAMLKNEMPESGQRGAVVHIASTLGIRGRAGAPAYCASKGAVLSLCQADAIDYAKDGIRINCVLPGLIETPLTTSSEEMIKALDGIAERSPMGRWGRPQEIANAAVFLCSSKASFVQGHGLVVDGGITAT